MEVIRSRAESPMQTVDEVVFELRRLNGMVSLMSLISGNADVTAEDVADAMNVIWSCLDQHIKTLDAIQWPKGNAIGA